MSKTTKILKISPIIAAVSVLGAAPAFAQIGGVTGTIDSTVDTTIRTDIKAPQPKVRADVPVSARIESRSRPRYYGTHYHGRYAHDHGHYGYDHYHTDGHSHTHGYASLTVEVKADEDRRDIGPMLTYGQKVESRKGKDLGRINGITRTEAGMVTFIMVDGVSKPIPVDTLRAEGDVLVTSKKKKHLK